MARRIRHHRRGSHQIRKWISLGGKILGATVMAYPAISGVTVALQHGQPDKIPREVLLNYVGFNVDAPGNGIDLNRLGGGVAAIAGGFVLLKAFSWMAKRF